MFKTSIDLGLNVRDDDDNTRLLGTFSDMDDTTVTGESSATLTLTSVEVDRLLESVEKFEILTHQSARVPLDPIPQSDLEMTITETQDGFDCFFQSGSLEQTVRWNTAMGILLFLPREAFSIPWSAFLFFLQAMRDFIALIK